MSSFPSAARLPEQELPRLFNRNIRLTIGGQSGQRIVTYGRDGLRIAFDIQKTGTKTPNRATIQIYNLNDASRKRLHEKLDSILLEVGYGDELTNIFTGRILTMNSSRTGSDWLTSLNVLDTGSRTARVSLTFGPGAKFREVALSTARATGLGLGNLESKLEEGPPRPMRSYSHGIVVHGSSVDQFNRLMESAGWEYSVQDGEIQILKPNESNPTSAKRVPIISPETGLVGSPDIAENGIVSLITLLDPRIIPGDPIILKSRQFDGKYGTFTVGHKGDVFENTWYTSIQCQVLNPDVPAGVG